MLNEYEVLIWTLWIDKNSLESQSMRPAIIPGFSSEQGAKGRESRVAARF